MRWTIGRRLAAIGAMSIMIAVMVGGIGFVQANRAAGRADEAFVVGLALSTTIDAQHTASVVLADASILTSPLPADRRTEVIDQMTEHAGELDKQLTALQQIRLDGPFEAYLVEFGPTIKAVLDDSARIAQTSGPLPVSTFDSVQGHWDTFDVQSDAIKTFLGERAAHQVAAAKSAAGSTRILLTVVTLLAALGIGAVTWLVARSIAGPIRATKALLERVAAGDFTGRIAVRGRDDLRDMADALNTTIERVGQALHRITQEATALTAASQRLTNLSGQVAAGAEQVAVEAGAASHSAGQVNDDVQTVAAGTEQMHVSIAEISRNAAEATTIVTAAAAAAHNANQTVAKLAESGNQISHVAKVIAAIAGQTNLLALNATIEAARAGEMGKGFAVVAGEVKDLASETAKATEDIGNRIAAIQTDSAEAATALEQISVTINRVVDIQHIIASAVEEQSASTQEIGSSVARAAGRTTDIATRVTRVTETSREATVAAADTRQAAEQLANTATSLQTVVAQFQLN